jgi:hypothetical protein
LVGYQAIISSMHVHHLHLLSLKNEASSVRLRFSGGQGRFREIYL